jgi:hypothetical protein
MTHCIASTGRFTPEVAVKEVEALIAWRRADNGWPGRGAEIRLLLGDTYGLAN